jgi:hypothetical protein
VSAPRSVRFEATTIAKLASYAARHPGLTSSSAAALLVEEGLRMDTHPGIVFRDGPAGRRAGISAGPDVWEVVRVVKSARDADPGATTEDLLELVADNSGLTLPMIRVALGYYGEFADEIDRVIADAEAAEAAAEVAVARTQRLLDAS